MRYRLKCHPDSRCAAVTEIEADLARPCASSLLLSYIVVGKISDLLMPAATASERTDELWRHTCFEAFLGADLDSGYYEFNFAPSTQWAAYRFDGYRSGMCVADEISVLKIEVESTPERYALWALLDLSSWPASSHWRLGLSAVIEETNGLKSYWALAHPAGQPDFHHSDCFAAELSSA
jgi:hypothetical protein